MAASYFFYDLETSGINPRTARVMQFAGQRTNMDLQPIGEPVNVLIRLTPDILPEPEAVLLTGITPEQTLSEGLGEAEFLIFFYKEVVRPETTFLGYNSVRFDDEFMRFLLYRNFYDAYEWQWTDKCSRWDLLDLVRLTRALRPEGITWPVTLDGKATNRLELLTKVNGLDHEHAHDALSDVMATIAIAKLIREHQPDLFNYLLEHRSKKKVSELVMKGTPFVYTSGKYPSATLHTTAAVLLVKHPQDGAIIYDLRHDPTPFLAMSTAELAESWKFSKDPNHVKLPVKTLKYNRCPAVAPLGVMGSPESQERLKLSVDTIAKHLHILKQQHAAFSERVLQALKIMDNERDTQQKTVNTSEVSADNQLYDGFFPEQDKKTMRIVRSSAPTELSKLGADFRDERLKDLLPLYKARNYPQSLTVEERAMWDEFRAHKLLDGEHNSLIAQYLDHLDKFKNDKTLNDNQRFLLEELQLYAESIVPADVAD